MKIAQDTSPQAADPLQVFVSFETATIHQPGLRGGGGEVDIYIYIYIQEVCVLIFPFYSARYVEVECDICCDRGKKQRDYTFITTGLFRDCSLINHETGL